MNKVYSVVMLLLLLIYPYKAYSDEASIDFKKDFERLQILQEKFQNSTNPIDKFNYSSAIIKYTEDMLERLKQVNEVYYRPAIMMLTGEIGIDKIRNTDKDQKPINQVAP